MKSEEGHLPPLYIPFAPQAPRSTTPCASTLFFPPSFHISPLVSTNLHFSLLFPLSQPVALKMVKREPTEKTEPSVCLIQYGVYSYAYILQTPKAKSAKTTTKTVFKPLAIEENASVPIDVSYAGETANATVRIACSLSCRLFFANKRQTLPKNEGFGLELKVRSSRGFSATSTVSASKHRITHKHLVLIALVGLYHRRQICWLRCCSF